MSNNPFAPSGDTIKFPQEEVGKRVEFVVREYRKEMGTNYQTKAPEEMDVLLVTTPDGQDGKIYLNKSMLIALGEAMRSVGWDGVPESGAKASLTYDGMQKAASGFDFKHFVAEYQRPANAAGAFAAPQAQQAAAAPAAAPAPAAPAANPSEFFGQG